MKPAFLKFGVIGSGGRGGHLAGIVQRSQRRARIVACCDVNETTLAQNRVDYGADVFVTKNHLELLSQKLDAVIIATPDYLHEEQAVAALELGITVYLEKPMALTIAGCDRILRTAARTKARLYVGHNMRHMPFVQKMRALIDGGAIGEVKACWVRHFVGHGGDFYFRDWHAERRYSTGLLLQKAAHDIDVIHWLSGGYTRRVAGMGALSLYGDLPERQPLMKGPRPGVKGRKLDLWPPTAARELNHRIDVEDLSSMMMLLDNGVHATYSQCHYTPDYWRSYTVIGTEGRMENFGNGEAGTVVRVWNRRISGYHAEGNRTYRIPPGAGGHGGADPRIMDEFIRYARDGGETTTSPLAARESVATGCRATESLRDGGATVVVPKVPARIADYFSPARP